MKNLKLLSAVTLFGCIFASSCGGNTNDDVIRVGMECNYAPFNWTCGSESEYTLPVYNEAGKYADGYDVQFVKRLAKETGKTVQIY